MKKRVGMTALLVLLVMVFALSAQAEPKLTKKNVNLSIGNCFVLRLKGNSTGQTVKWTTSNKKCAPITYSTYNRAVIKAKKTGMVKITAKIGTKQLTCKVKVRKNVKMPKTLNLLIGDKFTFNADAKASWKLSKNIAKITTLSGTKKAAVKAVKSGQAKLTAKTAKKTYKCSIRIIRKDGATAADLKEEKRIEEAKKQDKPAEKSDDTEKETKKETEKETEPAKKPVASVTLSETELTINVGDEKQLTAKYSPSDTTDDTTITWTSSNTSAASVSDGTVTAHKAGSAVIKAKIGSITASCNITVKNPIQTVSLDKTTLIVDKGSQAALQVTILPIDTSDDKTITWSSSDETVAAVANGIVTGNKAGNAVVTAKVGEKSASCYVQVNQTYGSVSGNITYLYNYYRGNVADEGALIYLIPTDGSSKDYFNDQYTSFMLIPPYDINQHGIYGTVVDGTGSYIIQNVPAGKYLVYAISHKTTDGDWYKDAEAYYDEVKMFLDTYLNDTTAGAMARAVSFNKYAVEWIEVFNNRDTVYSHDFGITYN